MQQGPAQVVFNETPVETLHREPSDGSSQVQSQLGQNIPEEVGHMEDEEQDASRSVGDMKLYIHYSRAAGWWNMAAYVVSCLTFVFGTMFPCKRLPRPQICLTCQLTSFSSCLAPVVDQLECNSTKRESWLLVRNICLACVAGRCRLRII